MILFSNFFHQTRSRSRPSKVKSLLEGGADPNEKDVREVRGRTRYSLLAHAARKGSFPCVSLSASQRVRVSGCQRAVRQSVSVLVCQGVTVSERPSDGCFSLFSIHDRA